MKLLVKFTSSSVFPSLVAGPKKWYRIIPYRVIIIRPKNANLIKDQIFFVIDLIMFYKSGEILIISNKSTA